MTWESVRQDGVMFPSVYGCGKAPYQTVGAISRLSDCHLIDSVRDNATYLVYQTGASPQKLQFRHPSANRTTLYC